MKGNRRYIIPDPIKEGNFEAKWRNVEVWCEEVAKTVRKELCYEEKPRLTRYFLRLTYLEE